MTESQRIKSIRNPPCYTRPKRIVWSKLETLQLLKGLDEHGKNNIQGLMEYVRNRTDKEIKNKIMEWEELSREEMDNQSVAMQKKNCNASQIMLGKLDKWLEYFKSETEMSCPSLFALSNTLLLIAEYGKFPSPDECLQVDFRALWRMLHCMLNGTPYFGLNQATAKMMHSSLSTLTKKLNKAACVRRFEPYLLNCTPHKQAIKNYGRPPYRGIRTPPSGQHVMEMPGMNPLNLPLSALSQLLPGLNNSGAEEVDSSEDSFSSDDE